MIGRCGSGLNGYARWIWLWSAAYVFVWLWLVWWSSGTAQIMAAVTLVVLWVVGGGREAFLAKRLKSLMSERHPGVIRSYAVGSLNAIWNHTRLLRAARDDSVIPTDGSIQSLGAQMRSWLFAVRLMFWLAPMLASRPTY